jgi:hypothetical protein
MALTADDRLDIHEVIALHGHLCDANAQDRFDEVFADDLEVDVSGLGLAPLPIGPRHRRRLDAYIEAGRRIGSGDTLAMHVTNTVVREDGDGARAWSKGLVLKADGTVAAFDYEDRLVRTDRGWRIRRRTVTPLREPGRGVLVAPRPEGTSDHPATGPFR